MTVKVRVTDGDDELLDAARIDLTAFGLPFRRTKEVAESLDRSLEWRRTTTTYLAELGGESVGTARVYDLALSLPGGSVVPVSGIGDVGVLPGSRGRGVFGELMRRMLDDGVERGHLAAVLYASEATIYGRFGFGPATRARRVRIPVARAALREDVSIAAGHAAVLEPAEWLGVLPTVYERSATRRGGEVNRSGEIWAKVLCDDGPAPRAMPGGMGEAPGADGRFCMVHRNPAGVAVAYALYSIHESWEPEGPAHSMTVDEVVAVDAASELALWQALFTVGLVQWIEVWVACDSPLLGALADRWAPLVTGEHDKLWLRILDPVAALAARRYRVPGEAVLTVGDGGPDGAPLTVNLSVASPGDVGTVVVDDGPADVTLGTAELAEVVLGGGSLASLASIGRVTEARPGEAARVDAMLGWSPLPFVTHHF
jgi:predicted acetyltransferase